MAQHTNRAMRESPTPSAATSPLIVPITSSSWSSQSNAAGDSDAPTCSSDGKR